MSFRKYGGTQFASSHNIVKSNVNTTDSFYVTQNVGQPNTYINFESDISGNMNIYGDLDVSGNVNVQGNINFDGDLTKNGIPYNPGGSSQWTSITGGGIYYSSGNVGIGKSTPSYTLDISGNMRTNADTSINGVTVGRGGGNNNTNTVFGYEALSQNTSATSSTENTAVGYQSGYALTACTSNTSVGYQALYQNSTGSYNTSIGFISGNGLTAGGSNTFLGQQTQTSNSSVSYSTAIGYNATITTSNQIVLGTSSEKIYLPGSYVGIGVYSPSNGYKLDVNGSVNATSYNTSSDYRIKKDVVTLDKTFTVDKLRPVTYNNNNLGKQDIGLIAHELQEVYPFLVNGEKEGENLQSVNYTGLIGILIKEIQELKERVKKLEEK